jgi:hypothetical protein
MVSFTLLSAFAWMTADEQAPSLIEPTWNATSLSATERQHWVRMMGIRPDAAAWLRSRVYRL